MEYLSILLKLIVGLSILNVWILRKGNSSQWRGGNTNSMEEEFAHYGLSKNVMIAVGIIKSLLAATLILSIWLPLIELYSALGIALMMAVAILMHAKVGDPIKRSFPASLFLIFSVIIIFI